MSIYRSAPITNLSCFDTLSINPYRSCQKSFFFFSIDPFTSSFMAISPSDNLFTFKTLSTSSFLTTIPIGLSCLRAITDLLTAQATRKHLPLAQNVDDSFETKKKTGPIFVNLTAAYDTVWHRGLTFKLLMLLPDKHMVRMIMELVRNQSFNLTTGDSKQSRLRHLKNGVPQGSVFAAVLFNICTYDFPSLISRKFAYANDLALLHSSGNWKDLEGTFEASCRRSRCLEIPTQAAAPATSKEHAGKRKYTKIIQCFPRN